MAVEQSEDPSFIDALNDYLQSRFLDIHVCLPGRITSYDKSAQTGDVQICVRRLVEDGSGGSVQETFPKLHAVPIDQMQSANFFASFPVGAGDFVWVHFVEQSMDNWISKGGENVDEPIKRRFDLRDCYATLARNPAQAIAETESDSLVIGGKGSRPRAYFQDSLITLGSKNPTEFVALATKVLTELDKIKMAYNTHTHTYSGGTGTSATGGAVTAVTGSTGVPSATYSSASVAATKVKAE